MSTRSRPAGSGSIVPATWKVPEVFRKRLGSEHGRQRMMDAEEHLLLILHAPPAADDEQRQGRLFWLDPQGEWHSTERGAGLASLQSHVAEFGERIDQLDDREEAATHAEHYFEVLNDLAPVLRAARHLHQTLQEARQARPENRDLIDLRDQAYNIERNAELLYTDANNSLQQCIARRAEEQADAAHKMAISAHRLNILAAIFFPIATLSALFGVNLRHTLEETSPPWPFIGLTAVGFTLGLVLLMFMLRPPGQR